LLHGLLRIFFDDIRREEWSPSYAGGGSRIDFLIPRYKLAIELKFSRDSMITRKLGEELIVDITKYRSHPDVRHLICLVFDQDGYVQNPRGMERDLSVPREGLGVTVRIYDR
jgi:REase_DpnII-MboI